ncbi:relaxase MobL [Bacillus safensis]|uniref:MobP2 family relaxase n=1 Tax=Bacillus safensis TaxID=561879 RepID=UPI00203E24CF|nr:MobP2 family relaxase [Bacillus safensis]MCM3140363.1 relaxase MobL [Bacillus safensis]
MTDTSPGVVIVSKFVTSSKDAFKNYVNYIDRDEAKSNNKQVNEKMFSMYQDYMGDAEKTSSLFTNHIDSLSKNESKQIKKLFEEAQKNKSIMWQDVISFDSNWLEKQGIINQNSNMIDERKIKEATRKAVNAMLKKEGLDKSAIWSAAIHYNTDNIHVHVATVEPTPTRERGKRKPLSIAAMKSSVINELLDRDSQRKLLNDLVRKQIVNGKKKNNTLAWRNKEMKPLFMFIYNHLPEDKRHWQYNYNTLKPLRPYIDELSKKYIEKHHKEEFDLFNKKLNEEVDQLKAAYGTGKNAKYEEYKENKINDLYTRMGNSFLKEMKDYDKQQERIKKNVMPNKNKNLRSEYRMQFALKKVERAFRNEYEDWKNQRHYEKLQQQIEYGMER